jgi:hypothetical protein
MRHILYVKIRSTLLHIFISRCILFFLSVDFLWYRGQNAWHLVMNYETSVFLFAIFFLSSVLIMWTVLWLLLGLVSLDSSWVLTEYLQTVCICGLTIFTNAYLLFLYIYNIAYASDYYLRMNDECKSDFQNVRTSCNYTNVVSFKTVGFVTLETSCLQEGTAYGYRSRLCDFICSHVWSKCVFTRSTQRRWTFLSYKWLFDNWKSYLNSKIS